MISDSYDLKLVDGVVYEADCARITVGGDNIGMLSLNPQQLSRPALGANDISSRHWCQPLR